jgi:hypothetical protein
MVGVALKSIQVLKSKYGTARKSFQQNEDSVNLYNQTQHLPCATFAAVILLLQDYAAEAPPPQNEAGPDYRAAGGPDRYRRDTCGLSRH